MSDYLPQDVLGDIFLRLPRNAIGFCSCVCKSWRSVITNPAFIHSQFIQTESKSKDTGDEILLFRRSSVINKEQVYSLCFSNETLDAVKDLDFPVLIPNRYSRMVGYCNGVLCLSDDSAILACDFFLWNPSVCQYLSLPYPFVFLNSPGIYSYAVVGFGFDSFSCDYKVVILAYLKEKDRVDEHIAHVHLYSLNANSWKDISAKTSLSYRVAQYHWTQYHWTQVFCNRYIHWIASNSADGSEFGRLILRFDVAHEVFDEMSLPESLVDDTIDWNMSMTMTVIGGELSVVYFNNGCEIWTMKDYGVEESWIKRFQISWGVEFGFLQRWTLVNMRNFVGLNGNGKLILEMNGGELFSYCCESRYAKAIDICGLEDSFYLNRYTESLVLLGKGNTNLEASSKPSLSKTIC